MRRMRRVRDDFFLELREQGIDTDARLGQRFVENRVDHGAIDGREYGEARQFVMVPGGESAQEFDGVRVLFGRKQQIVHVAVDACVTGPGSTESGSMICRHRRQRIAYSAELAEN